MKFDPLSLPSAQKLAPQFVEKFAELTQRQKSIHDNYQETLRSVMQVNTDQLEALDVETKALWDEVNATHNLGNGEGYSVDYSVGVVAKSDELHAHYEEVKASLAPNEVAEVVANGNDVSGADVTAPEVSVETGGSASDFDSSAPAAAELPVVDAQSAVEQPGSAVPVADDSEPAASADPSDVEAPVVSDTTTSDATSVPAAESVVSDPAPAVTEESTDVQPVSGDPVAVSSDDGVSLADSSAEVATEAASTTQADDGAQPAVAEELPAASPSTDSTTQASTEASGSDAVVADAPAAEQSASN